MAKYRKKPVVIEALQLTWDNWSEMCDFVGVGRLDESKPEGFMKKDDERIHMFIPTLEGVMEADEYDWIIKGVKGEFYPCKPVIFDLTYEKVEEDE